MNFQTNMQQNVLVECSKTYRRHKARVKIQIPTRKRSAFFPQLWRFAQPWVFPQLVGPLLFNRQKLPNQMLGSTNTCITNVGGMHIAFFCGNRFITSQTSQTQKHHIWLPQNRCWRSRCSRTCEDANTNMKISVQNHASSD